MFKQIFITLCALAALAMPSAAQSVGEWYVFPRFDGQAQSLIDTPSIVYYVSGGSLYSYDKDSGETYSYSTQNKLADTNITKARYNYTGKYLFVAYANSNIDLIYDDGRVINMPDIKDATLTTSKVVNDVDFYKGKIYVATNFGLVVFDDSRHEVVESGIYNKDIQFVGASKDYIIVYPRDSYEIYRSSVIDRHNTFNTFHKWFNRYVGGLQTAGEDLYLINGNDGSLQYFDLDWDILEYSATVMDIKDIKSMHRDAYDNVHIQTADQLLTLNSTGEVIDRLTLADQVKNQTLAYEKDFGSIWGLDSHGLANYDLTTSPLTLLSDKHKPSATTIDEAVYFNVSADGSRIYVNNIGSTAFKTVGNIPYDGTWYVQRTDCFENGNITDEAIAEAKCEVPVSIREQTNNNSTLMYGGCSRLAVDPDNPRRYYIGNTIEGLFVAEGGKQLGKFNSANAPINPSWGGVSARVFDVQFDPDGNLWLGAQGNASFCPYLILTKDKVKGDLSKITKSDWITTKHLGVFTGFKDMGSVMCTKSNMFINFDGTWFGKLCVYDTKGTYANTADDVIQVWEKLTDQDGNSYTAERWVCGVEDLKGRVWLGSSAGIIELTNPASFTNPSARIKRLKVPRNDGTGLADYLLATEQVNCIAVDGINRKWIATENSGVYLVSEDGDRIIENYTTDNSQLPSNSVYSVVCDPKSSDVYFGLKTGVIKYTSTASPARNDYSEVYAYPNPVRPDYTGWITITGLMDDSLVKIADSAGNVIFQGRSTGGMMVWDGCDAAGNRVHSGVYLVLASQNATGSSSGAVTKIVVIN